MAPWPAKQSSMIFRPTILRGISGAMTPFTTMRGRPNSDWIETWDNEFESLGAAYVIPGHGHPTNMAQVRRYTRDYLLHLRQVVGDLLKSGGDLQDSYYVDQSAFKNLDTFEELAKRNAGMVFEQMEFE